MLFFSIVIGTLLTNRLVVTPLQRLEKAVTQISKGDLCVELDTDAENEVGRLSRSFAQMVEELRGVIAKVRDITNTVASASAEIAATTEEMSAGRR